jgi:EAL domain-containing protein (putative c-di-GMP-specific phosphodiesterase class I)
VQQSVRGARPVILRSIISLAQDLGMDVVAEGAETEADAIELYQLGCGYAQGYAFGRPISAQEARRLVGATPEAAWFPLPAGRGRVSPSRCDGPEPHRP